MTDGPVALNGSVILLLCQQHFRRYLDSPDSQSVTIGSFRSQESSPQHVTSGTSIGSAILRSSSSFCTKVNRHSASTTTSNVEVTQFATSRQSGTSSQSQMLQVSGLQEPDDLKIWENQTLERSLQGSQPKEGVKPADIVKNKPHSPQLV